MVTVKVSSINFGEKYLDLVNGKAKEIIDGLGLNDDAVILVDENGEIYTKDRKIKDGSHIKIIEVFSGG